MQPQEQQPPLPELPPAWARDLNDRTSNHSLTLALVVVLLLANLGLTFYVFHVVHSVVKAVGG